MPEAAPVYIATEAQPPSEPGSSGVQMGFVIPVILASAAVAVAVGLSVQLIRRRVRSITPQERRFRSAASWFGLGGRERRLLRAIGAAAGIEPSTLLLSESAFRSAAETYMELTNQPLPAREATRIKRCLFSADATDHTSSLAIDSVA